MVPSIAAACAFAVLVGLGTWQVQRKAWKEALIATVSERFAAPPAALPPPAEWARLDPATDEFRRVRFTAEFLNDKEALVFTTGSSLHGGDAGPGYWVFTPARVLDRIVMVNRGFVPEARKDPATRAQGQIAGPAEIVGVHALAGAAGAVHAGRRMPAKNLWFARDPAAIAQAKGSGPSRRSMSSRNPRRPRADCRAPGALQPTFPNNHLGYAITWYGLALVLAGSFSVWFVGRCAAADLGARFRPAEPQTHSCAQPAFRLLCGGCRRDPGAGVNFCEFKGLGEAWRRDARRDVVRRRRTEPVRYISTRGEAPPLGFVDVTLAGLARDGGLYVPETWPHLDRATIAGFAGRPYAEVAVEVIAAVRRRRGRRGRPRPHGARGLWRPSAIRPWRRSSRSAPTPSCSSCFTGRRSPSRTWRCSSSPG